jgi:TonB-dependent receptor
MMKLRMKLISLPLLLLMLTIAGFAQGNGSVYGVVSDKTSGEPLPGATVFIEGMSTGTVSNVDGAFRLMNVSAGSYTFIVSFIGYKSEKVEKTIVAGEAAEMNVALSVDAVGLEEVVISAQMMGQRAAINQQLNSDALTNVVSADKIRELPDVNAAEAIGRLPGVSVQRSGGEASKVVVRGLSPELTSVTINGVKLPATGSGDRSVDLSMISPELLSNIELFKSPTADMDGDFIGGVVNLGVTKAPDIPVSEIRLYGGYNNLKNEFGNYKGSLNTSRRYFDNKLGLMLKANYEKTNRSSERINVSWNKNNIDEGKILVSNMTITDENKRIQRFGGSAQVDYQYGSGYVMGQALYSGRYTDKYLSVNRLENAGRIFHQPTHNNGTLATFQTLLSGKQRFAGIEAEWRLSRSRTTNRKPYDVSLDIVQYNGVEASEMETNPEALNNKRNSNYADAQLEKYYFSPSWNEHENLQAALDFKYDFSLGNKISGFLKFGGKLTTDDRIYDHNHQQVYWYYMDQAYINQAVANWPHEMYMTQNNKISLYNFVNQNEGLSIWNDSYSIYPQFDFNKVNEWQSTQNGELDPVYNEEYLKYAAYEKVMAGYVMSKVNIGKIITLIPGLRYEHSDNNYSGFYSDIDIHGETGKVSDTTSIQNYGELLPSIHLKVKPTGWIDIRASAARTLARPGYQMVAPRVRLDLNDAVVYQSNTELEHTTAWNYDLNFSFFSNKLGLLTLGGFYKEFDNYFTKTSRRMGSDEAEERGYPKQVYDVEEDYMNFDNSRVYGLEFDLQTNFSYLPAPFNGIVLNINATRLWSETYSFTYQPYEYYDRSLRRMIFLPDSSFYESNATSLPNQVDWITNVSLGYDLNGFSIRLSAIYQAAYLTGFSSRGTSETTEYFYSYVDDHLRFDASISQKIGKKLMLMANLSNITAESERRYTWKPQYVTSENRYGRTFDIGLRYKF